MKEPIVIAPGITKSGVMPAAAANVFVAMIQCPPAVPFETSVVMGVGLGMITVDPSHLKNAMRLPATSF